MKRPLLKFLLRDQSGSVLMLVGLSAILLFAFVGAGYDLGRQRLVRQKIQQASDASALAASAMMLGTPDNDRKATALRYFSLNYPDSYLGVARPTATVTIGANDVEVKANAPVPTSFVGNLGIDTLPANGLSKAQIKRTFNKIDAIVIMDNSGSMRTAGDVGSSSSLNGTLPSAFCMSYYTGLLTSAPYFWTPAAATTYSANNYCTVGNSGVIGLTRVNALRYSASALTDLLMNPNPHDNQIAYVTWDTSLMNSLNFTKDASTGKNFLLNIYGRGGTDSGIGLQKAISLGTGYRSGAVHAVILMTDGVNNAINGVSVLQPLSENNSLNYCQSIKASGTLIYTIGFGTELSNGSSQSAAARQFLSNCATGPNGASKPNQNAYYFVAPDAAALADVFNRIAGNLQGVRILN